jgi:hypothetical protein
VIRRENYPFDRLVPPTGSTDGIWTHPGHLITFISPMIIVNLLPYDLHYAANDIESGIIRPSQQMALHEVCTNSIIQCIDERSCEIALIYDTHYDFEGQQRYGDRGYLPP